MADLKIEKHQQGPSWVVYLCAAVSVLLLIQSVLVLPAHLDGPWYSAAFGIFKVVLWALLSKYFIKDIVRLRTKKADKK